MITELSIYSNFWIFKIVKYNMYNVVSNVYSLRALQVSLDKFMPDA